MLPRKLFRSRNFGGANLLTLFLYTALSGAFFFFPLNLIQVQGYSATAAGAATHPFVLIMFSLSRWSGGLVKRYGAKLPLVVGPAIASLGFVLFALPGVGGSYWKTFFPAVLVLGLGMAVTVAPLTTTVMNSVPQNRTGIASGVNNAVARSAGLVAIAVLGIVMLQVFSSRLERRLGEAKLPEPVAQSLRTQRTRLAAADVSDNYDSATRQQVRILVKDSFLAGFRTVMLIGAALAAAS